MKVIRLSEKAGTYLRQLCLDIAERPTGSSGNQAATAWFAKRVSAFGFATECPEFECIDWTHGDIHLAVGNETFEAFVSPFSLGVHAEAPLVVVSTVGELEAAETSEKIVLVRGELACEQLMPKNFPFYNPDEHQHIIRLLETKNPGAIIAATSRNPELAGGVYPFPLIEDGDFDIPSVFMREEEGERLARHEGGRVSLSSEATRIAAKGCNVIARKGLSSRHRLVVCAHIDAKQDTPGALDNGTGVALLLLLAELLEDYSGDLGIELVALNGEDYYSAPGQKLYLASNAHKFDEIVLAINMDLAGYREGNTAYSLYGCPEETATAAQTVFSGQEGMVEGEPWYQSDHSIFIQKQIPAMAITSDQFMELSTHVTHTAKDTPELVDCDKLANIAMALRNLVLDLDRLRL